MEALQSIYPSLTASDLEEFNDVYSPALFSSVEEWFRTATGEVYVRCGVRNYLSIRVPVRSLLTGDGYVYVDVEGDHQ